MLGPVPQMGCGLVAHFTFVACLVHAEDGHLRAEAFMLARVYTDDSSLGRGVWGKVVLIFLTKNDVKINYH